MKKGLFFLMGGLLAGLILVLFLAGRAPSSATGESSFHPQTTNWVTPQPTLFTPTPRIGPYVSMQAPDFTLKTLEGETVRLQDYRGKVVLVNFWASWCLPCKAEMPAIQAAYEQNQEQGLVVLGIDLLAKDQLADVQAYLKDTPVSFPILLDEDGLTSQGYLVSGIPTSFWVDQAGIIRHFQTGPMDDQQIAQYLEEMLR